MNLLHLVVRGWRERPARTILSMASVAIAVAAVLGTALAQSSVREGIRQLSGMVDKFPALEVVSAAGGRFDAADVPDLQGVSGVVAAVPVANRAAMARVHGQRFRTVLLGIPRDVPDAWTALAIDQGRACESVGEAVLSADLAKSLKAGVGDRLLVITRRGPRSATIVGLADAGRWPRLLRPPASSCRWPTCRGSLGSTANSIESAFCSLRPTIGRWSLALLPDACPRGWSCSLRRRRRK